MVRLRRQSDVGLGTSSSQASEWQHNDVKMNRSLGGLQKVEWYFLLQKRS